MLDFKFVLKSANIFSTLTIRIRGETKFSSYTVVSLSDMYVIAAHWDGFQPFGNKKRSTGAIEVSIATMSKQDRLCTEEIYTVGFVPSYDLPDARPHSLDPFVEPLVQDLKEGFIEGGIH